MRLAITGGRDFTDTVLILEILDALTTGLTINVGDCPTGVDAIVRHHFHHHIFVADWNKHGKAAGPIRNGEMLEQSDFLLAFPGGRGTEDCVRQAKKRGIPVLRVET